LFFECATQVVSADSVRDGEYIFITCTLRSPGLSDEGWLQMAQKIVKLLRLTGHSHVERQASVRSSSWCRPCHARLDQLQNCDLTTLAQMYEVVVATSEAERSLTKVSEAVQNCGVDIVLSSMHFAAQSLTSGHTVLSLAPSCDICSMHPREASTSEVCHLHFIDVHSMR
jgi:hypothetical protein